MSKLQRILFLQGQRCFFCEHQIPAGEESLEHLVPVSHGGPDRHDNVVVCCKALNNVFGSISIKEKVRAVLKQNGSFVCPRLEGKAVKSKATAPSPPPSPVGKPAAPEVLPKQPAAPRRPLGMVLNPEQSLGLKWPEKLAP